MRFNAVWADAAVHAIGSGFWWRTPAPSNRSRVQSVCGEPLGDWAAGDWPAAAVAGGDQVARATKVSPAVADGADGAGGTEADADDETPEVAEVASGDHATDGDEADGLPPMHPTGSAARIATAATARKVRRDDAARRQAFVPARPLESHGDSWNREVAHVSPVCTTAKVACLGQMDGRRMTGSQPSLAGSQPGSPSPKVVLSLTPSEREP